MNRHGPVGIAVVGAGVISQQYLTNLTSFPDTRVHVVADLLESAASARAAEFEVPASGRPEVAFEHPDVELVVNLTIPAAHVDVGLAAIGAGKHVWNEKPLATDRVGARELLSAAEKAGVRVGGAPDTFLGPGSQAALRAISDGQIGSPLTGVFMFQTNGPEGWHPNPDFFYASGAGPLFDIGPYYLTTMVQCFGPVVEVAAIGSTSRDQRIIGSGPRAGEVFDVSVPTHVGVLLRFEDGRSAQGILSFDSPLSRQGFVEVTGTEATMSLPDPNRFDGEVGLWRSNTDAWDTTVVDEAKAGRGIGVLEMARAIRGDVPHRAGGDLAYHVLDIMCAIDEAVPSGTYVPVESRVERAAPLPVDWDPYATTL
jgi:predicted dehydrogenase